jgi:hypothetical protein
VLQLGKGANASGRDRRHIDQAANLVEHQTSTGVIGLGIKDIDRHVGALVIEVRAPDQQGVLLLSERCFDGQATTEHIGVLHRLIDVGASHRNGSCVEGRKARIEIPVVELSRHGAACEIAVLVVKTQHGVLDLVLICKYQPLIGLAAAVPAGRRATDGSDA